MRIIIPNYHVILIHFPLAFLGFGLLIEIVTCMARGSSLRQAARWMILLGTLMLLPVTTSGIFAFFDVVGHGQGSTNSWADLTEVSKFTSIDWELAQRHILFNGIGAGLALIAVITWLGASDSWRKRLYLPGLLALMISMGLITFGAWHGGEMVYREGFGVQEKFGVLPATENTPGNARERIDQAISPMQIHIIMAGLVFAIAAAALGLTMRRSWVGDDLLVQRLPVEEAASQLAGAPTAGETAPLPISATPTVDDPANATLVMSVAPRVPSARFWIFAALVALFTIMGGLYVGEYLFNPGIFDLKQFQETFRNLRAHDAQRKAMHIVFGSSILVLMLILGIIARWTPRRRRVLATFSTLLVLVMAAQVWIGILLLYDGTQGSILRFKPPEAKSAAMPAGESSPPAQIGKPI